MKIFATATCAAILALASTAPAAAQDEAGDRVNMVIAYSETDCPEQSAENEIVGETGNPDLKPERKGLIYNQNE